MKIFMFCLYIIMMILFIISIFCGQTNHVTTYGVLAVLTYLQYVECKIDDLKK
jgi:FtsH-binding integral membrane protein